MAFSWKNSQTRQKRTLKRRIALREKKGRKADAEKLKQRLKKVEELSNI